MATTIPAPLDHRTLTHLQQLEAESMFSVAKQPRQGSCMRRFEATVIHRSEKAYRREQWIIARKPRQVKLQ